MESDRTAVQTGTHPGFMAGWRTPLMVLFTEVSGMSVLHETVFENRLLYVPALQQIGCEIELFDICRGGRTAASTTCQFASVGLTIRCQQA